MTTEMRSVDTLEFLRVLVSAGSIDPTGDAVEMAIVPLWTTPVDLDFAAAEWETGGPPYYCRQLAGAGGSSSGGVDLEVGQWIVWVRVTDSPEIPTRPAYQLEVY